MDRKEHDTERLLELLRKYEGGTLTPAERGLLESWYNQAAPERKHLDEATVRRHLDRLATRLPIRKARPNYLRWIPYAAAVLIAATAATWILYGDQIVNRLPGGRQGESQTVNAQEILPGGNRATLTLADGRIIDLSPEHEGIIIQDGISYLDGSEVIENGKWKMENEGPDKEKGILNSQLSILNSITTPKGGTYHVTLPDGSKVWLNAGSTLKYPSRFSGEVREVILEGEAFFEIKEQRINEQGRGQAVALVPTGREAQTPKGPPQVPLRPFRVLTVGQEIEVLGTEFNVSAYTDAPDTRTTLVEGSVKVSNLTSHRASLLAPGDQSIMHGAEIQVRQVDTAPFIAWKNGLFLFKQTGIHDVMNQLSRWYDIEVRFETAIPADETFSGKMGRDVQLVSVLDFLSGSGINYRLEGRQLIIEGLNYR